MSKENAVAGPSTQPPVLGRTPAVGLHADTINKANPRGIPYAPFVTNVDEFVGGQNAGVEGIVTSFKEMTGKYQYMEVNLQQKRKGLEEKIPDIDKTLKVVRFLEARRCKRLGTKPTTILQSNSPTSPTSPTSDSEDSDLDSASDSEEEEDDLLDEANELEAWDDDDEEGEVKSKGTGKGKSGKALKTLYELNDTLFAEAEIEENGEVGLWLGANTMLMYPLDEAIILLAEKLTAAKKNLQNTKEDLEFLREQVTVMEVNFARVHNWDVKRRRMLKEQEQKTGQVKSLKDEE